MFSGYSKKDNEQFVNALKFASTFLGDSVRLSGQSSLDHNKKIAAILAESKFSSEVVTAGLLYGVQRHAFPSDISKRFGQDVSDIVFGLGQLSSLKAKNKKIEAESLRKIFLVTLKDVRVIFVKLASKLDNLYSIDVFPAVEQKRIANEILDVYAPLASRLGVVKIKNELEEYAFKIINPRKYAEISKFLKSSSSKRQKKIESIISEVKNLLYRKVKIVRIKGRPKHIYSIYKKFTDKGRPLTKQFDHQGIRIIVPTEHDCYSVLGLLHQEFDPVPGRLKDYIVKPKENMYQSIHTVVFWPNGSLVEFQIRTPQMDEIAEEGVASHWSYKKLQSDSKFEMKTAWLRSVVDLQNDAKAKEYLQDVKVNVFSDRMFCYTPQGDAIDLPVGATVLDFAYHIHQGIGDKAVGGRVNGVFVPLRHEIVSGDIVEVNTNKHQRPRRDWLKFAVTARAKNKIRRGLKDYENIPVGTYYRISKRESEEIRDVTVSSEFPKLHNELAKCCNPVVGEPIVGIITKRKIVSVHNSDCRQALKEEDRWVPVEWIRTFSKSLRFSVSATNRSGILADLLHTVTQASFTVKEAKAKLMDQTTTECSFVVVPQEYDLVVNLINRIRGVKGVHRVWMS